MAELPAGQYWGHRFVLYTINGVPVVDEKDYRFDLGGLVEKPISLSYNELVSIGKEELRADFHCVTKWSIRDCTWSGVPFSTLARMAGVRDSAEFAFVQSLDGYTTVIPAENMADAMLATELNGEKIPQEQGAPVRLVVPSLYGWKSAKWVNAIEMTDEYMDGYWEARGYHERGDYVTEERFKDPAARFIHKKVAQQRSR